MQKMQTINPFLWFDNQSEEAANFYVSIFKNSKVNKVAYYGQAGPGSKGSVMAVSFELDRLGLVALNGGAISPFTPAISFFINCQTSQEVDVLWNNLSHGGKILMDLDKYPFSEKFGWLSDKYGISWQISLANNTQKIMPFLLFVGDQYGKAEEAINYYISLFENSHIIKIEYNDTGNGQRNNGKHNGVKHAIFSLNGQQFMASESDAAHSFSFAPAISFVVNCETQGEIDHFWEKLSEGGKTEQCGWLSDKYGISWQIVPKVLGQMMSDNDAKKPERVMKAMLQMKKIVIKNLNQFCIMACKYNIIYSLNNLSFILLLLIIFLINVLEHKINMNFQILYTNFKI